MTGMIASFILAVCAHNPDCIDEVTLLDPKTPQEVARYHKAVMFRESRKDRPEQAQMQRVFECSIKPGGNDDKCWREVVLKKYEKEERQSKRKDNQPVKTLKERK